MADLGVVNWTAVFVAAITLIAPRALDIWRDKAVLRKEKKKERHEYTVKAYRTLSSGLEQIVHITVEGGGIGLRNAITNVLQQEGVWLDDEVLEMTYRLYAEVETAISQWQEVDKTGDLEQHTQLEQSHDVLINLARDTQRLCRRKLRELY